jgi:transposase
MAQRIESIDVSIEELEQLVDCAGQGPLPVEGQRKLKAAVATLGVLAGMLNDKDTTIRKLRALLMPLRTTEKTRKVLKPTAAEEPKPEGPAETSGPKGESRPHKKGHGRNGPGAYPGAQKVSVAHPTLKRTDHCPGCEKGKVYPLSEPKSLVRIVGQAPVAATIYELEALRCNLCGEVFTAPPPAGVGTEKYDASAVGMIALLKYGSGVPLYRMQKLESHLGIPLAAATQWELVSAAALMLAPVEEELIRQAAQGSLVHNDDTSMRILKFERAPGDSRTGLFTSGIVSVVAAGHRIATFFTGSKHAGENLADVLRRRATGLAPPIQMCDALSRNAPAAFVVILANCLAHGRRHFVDVVSSFPGECRYVLETLREVFHFDALATEQGLTPQERLSFHQQHSLPLMDSLHQWCGQQFEERKVEPNSGLGKAIKYLLNHWQKLTLFLREPGAPLDNNICERALKKAILHRKNALFYRTLNGARVGDLFMSLIHTAELCGANPFDYLTELLRHPRELVQAPSCWMPWNYRENLAQATDIAA